MKNKNDNSVFSIQNSHRGFTLVEALVAISVVLVAIVGPLTIVSKNLGFALFVRDQVVAYYLAQEAIEFIRNTRDNNVLAGQSWLNGLGACTSGVCAIDSAANTVTGCVTSCDPLKLSSSGVYGYTSGTNTIFVREVALNEISSGREATIDAVIRWNQGTVSRNFTIREHIFNWQ